MIIIPMVILIIMTAMIIAMMMIKVRVMTCQNDVNSTNNSKNIFT